MIAIGAPCVPCTIVYRTVHVGQDFRVNVADQGRSINGLTVELRSDSVRGGLKAVTDRNGLAFFHHVSGGQYFLSADHDAGILDSVAIEVSQNGPTGITVPLRWPSIAPTAARALKGILRLPEQLPGKSQPTISLELMDGVSGRVLRRGQTQDNGEFDFPTVSRGLYFVHVKVSEPISFAGEQISGFIAVAVDPGAKSDSLDLELGWTSCGLNYTDGSQCKQRDVAANKLSGRVLDATGAAIREADILLLDLNGDNVEKIQSDSGGQFATPRSLDGVYQLVVRSAGFTTFGGLVRFESNADRPPNQGRTRRVWGL